MGKIIAIANYKGGCCKTTIAVNLGVALANMGKKILLVDLDGQQNLTISIVGKQLTSPFFAALLENRECKPFALESPKVDLLPSSQEFKMLDFHINESLEPSVRPFLLKKILQPLKSKYDYIFIDNAPSVSVMLINALYAADEVLVPLLPEVLSVNGLVELDEFIKANFEGDKVVKIKHIVLNRFLRTKRLHNITQGQLSQKYGSLLYNTTISENIRLAEAPINSQSIFDYDPTCKGAKQFGELAKEFLSRSK